MINTPKVWVPFWYSFLLLASGHLPSQVDSLMHFPANHLIEDLIQSYLETRSEEINLDFESIRDKLESLKKNPINLNEPGQPDLDDFILLTPAQISSLKAYISKYGDLLSLFELQVVPGFDVETIRRIRPFVRLNPALEPTDLKILDLLTKGKSQIMVRWSRILEPQSGYQVQGSGPGYAGNPDKYYFRFLHQYSNRFSLGLHGEKDPGEEFLRGNNSSGFDFYSFHLSFRRINKLIDELNLGDYTIGLGQGLLIQTGFGAGKNALATSIQKGGRILKPYTSTNEFNFFRGFSTALKMGPRLDLILFYSNRKKDGNEGNDTGYFSSFLESGYHRTPNEIESKKLIREVVVGQAIKYKWKSGHFAMNTLFTQFDHFYQKSDQLYNAFAFAGKQLLLGSVDHRIHYNNLLFFGETALGKSGAFATLQGLQWSMDKHLDFALLYRNLGKKYPGLYSGVFSESSTANNEQGWYLGAEFKSENRWKFAAYLDFWKHPWFKFNSSGPSFGREQFIRVTYLIKKKLETYFQYKIKIRQENQISSFPNKSLNPTALSHSRMQLNYLWGSGWETRTRMECSFFRNSGDKKTMGFLGFQDLLYHPLKSKLSFTTRFAYFNTDGYDSRIYAYENDILNNYAVPAFNDEGIRYYLNLRWDWNMNLLIEGRWARTHSIDQSLLGSGLDEIQGNTRSELKIQLRWVF